ncbi:MAG: helix-hairpin-helix domain-containing protein [Pseudonocardiaceae bacterium]
MSRLVDEQGRPLRLGDKLGEGGEGAVYRLAGHSSQAIKIYASPLTGERAQKIKILTQFRQTDIGRFTAWPSGLVLDEKGRARGLLLPVVEHGKDIHHLYTPSSRRKHFSTVDWRFLVHVSGNVARAFAAVHALGLVIGDVNPGSILVLGDGTVRLIDVDSFQVPVPGGRPLLCTVAVPLFLPPELDQASLNSVVRTSDHDAFGLAITIFQLLMLGRHPYAGRFLGAGEMPIERAIVEHRFAFGAHAADRQMQRPPNTVGMEILPSRVAALFESAFAHPVPQRLRPSAEEWVQALDQLAAEFAHCRRNPKHYYPRSTSLCPWCDFEQSTGVLLFGVPTTAFTQRYENEYKQLVGLIAAVPRPVPPTLVAATSSVVVNPAAQKAVKTPGLVWGGYLLGLLLMVGGLVLLPRGGLFILLGAVAVVFGFGARRQRRKPWINAYRAAKSEEADAAAELEQANRFPAHAVALAAATRASRLWDGLPSRRAERYRQIEKNKRQEQLQQFLQTQLIESARIKGIGAGRVAMLSSYGIDTAGDIEVQRVQQVPQFGPVLAGRLVSWRQEREHAFVYDPSRPLPREAVIRLEKEIEDAQRRLVDDLRRALRALETAHASEPVTAATAAQRLRAAKLALLQAEADVLAATGRMPT